MKMPKPRAGLPSCSCTFGQACREVVHDMIDRVRQRHIHQGTIRKDARDLAAEALVEAVVVVDVQEPAAIQVLPKPC